MKKTFTFILIPIFALLFTSSCNTKKEKDYLHETPEAYNKRMKWWKDARFGMFIHWGAYAVPAGIYHGKVVPGAAEWIMYTAKIPVKEYEQFAREFNPVKFNADEWVKTAKQAGMKYIVITAKHHDGFCMWDTKLTDYNIVDYTPFKRDVLKELSEACKKEGMNLGFYYSIMDWHNPLAHGDSFPKYRDEYMKPQLKELLTRYGDIKILWFDGEWIDEWTEEQGRDLYNYVRNLKPDIIVNNRVGKGRAGMQGMNKGKDYVGDFGTPEQGILDTKSDFSWETCMTMNHTWGYKNTDHDWKSPEVLIHNLIDISSKGGNYLLNVGPDAEGIIPAASVSRLQAMGRWLDINGEAIYGTRTFRFFGEGDDIRFTTSAGGKYIYAIALDWPGASLTLESVQADDDAEIRLLGYDPPLKWKTNENQDLLIRLPEKLQDENNRPCRYAWTFKIKGKAFPLVAAPAITTTGGVSGNEILYRDTVTVLMTVNNPAVRIHYTTDGSLPLPSSPVYEKPLHLNRSVVIKAKAYKKGIKASFTSEVTLTNISRDNLPAAAFAYYEGDWDSLPDFSSLRPLKQGYVRSISLQAVHPRKTGYAIVYMGRILIPQKGKYTFFLTSDDGSRLFLRNNLVIDYDGLHGYDTKEATVALKQGSIPFRLEYFQKTGGQGLKLSVKRGDMKEKVPVSLLFGKN